MMRFLIVLSFFLMGERCLEMAMGVLPQALFTPSMIWIWMWPAVGWFSLSICVFFRGVEVPPLV